MLCKHGICRRAVSIRPPVTFVYCVKTTKHIFKNFSPSGFYHHYKHRCKIPTEPPNGGIECRWGMKISWFSTSISLHRMLSMRRPSIINSITVGPWLVGSIMLSAEFVFGGRRRRRSVWWQEASTLRRNKILESTSVQRIVRHVSDSWATCYCYFIFSFLFS